MKKTCPNCQSTMTCVLVYVTTHNGLKLVPNAYICPKCSYHELVYPRPYLA
ncbi:hypothetical protein ES703_41124 [subsurface metagenome]